MWDQNYFMTTLFIKNMVCNRCIMVVQSEMDKLGLNVRNIKLGEVALDGELSEGKKITLEKTLETLGFELIDDRKSRIIEKIGRASCRERGESKVVDEK